MIGRYRYIYPRSPSIRNAIEKEVNSLTSNLVGFRSKLQDALDGNMEDVYLGGRVGLVKV